jgi:hypothetical protein
LNSLSYKAEIFGLCDHFESYWKVPGPQVAECLIPVQVGGSQYPAKTKQ